MIDWTELAACRGVDTDVFFPAPGGKGYGTARSYCGRCPVRNACLQDALRAEEGLSRGSNMRHGMYGGLTPDERALMGSGRVVPPRRGNRGSPLLSLGALLDASGCADATTSQKCCEYDWTGAERWFEVVHYSPITALADRIGVNRRSVHRWARVGVPLKTAEKACETLGLSPEAVWGAEYRAAVCEKTA